MWSIYAQEASYQGACQLHVAVYNAQCMNVDHVPYGQTEQSEEARILRQGFAVAVYPRQFVEDVGVREVAAMRDDMDLGGYPRISRGISMCDI